VSDSPDLPDSLASTIEHSELEPLTADLLDLGLHALTEGALKDLPVFAAMNAVWKAGVTIRDGLLTQKLAAFLAGVSSVSREKREEMLSLLEAESRPERIGELLFAHLDRFESAEKARLLAKAFRLMAEGVINADEFLRVGLVLENLPRRDLSTIASWRTTDPNAQVDRIKRSLYLSVGILWFVLNFSSTGFVWHDRLCTIFSDHLLPS
jgi:hypothetical protein